MDTLDTPEVGKAIKHALMLEAASESSTSQQDTPVDLAAVKATVEEHFSALWPAVEAGLSTCATLLLADNANPVALIYVGPPSAGKTTVASMFEKALINGRPLCYRSDKFTPAAFVSHSAKATKKELAEVDLLPKIKDRVLLTPELSTIFQGKEDDLRERFSIITRVLDGQGLTTDSGTHGQRGYVGDYLFAWIGCTTPFTDAVWRIMAQLGSRLFFLVMDAMAEPTLEELVKSHSQPVTYKAGLQACQRAVHAFLEDLFQQSKGIGEVSWDASQDPKEVVEGIARSAMLLAVMRTPICRDVDGLPQSESPHRANAVLYNLARGRALVHGRTQLSLEDLPMVIRVTLSSIPQERRKVLQALASNACQALTVKQVEDAGVGSRHTAERVMEDLDRLGIMKFETEGTGKAARLIIRPEWAWCMAEDFRALLSQGNNLARIRGCVSTWHSSTLFKAR